VHAWVFPQEESSSTRPTGRQQDSRAPTGRWRLGCCLGLEQGAGSAEHPNLDGYKHNSCIFDFRFPRSGCVWGLIRLYCPLSGVNLGHCSVWIIPRLGLLYGGSLRRDRVGVKWTKMSDSKVKVAVRVRPMNRRGKCYNPLQSQVYSDRVSFIPHFHCQKVFAENIQTTYLIRTYDPTHDSVKLRTTFMNITCPSNGITFKTKLSLQNWN